MFLLHLNFPTKQGVAYVLINFKFYVKFSPSCIDAFKTSEVFAFRYLLSFFIYQIFETNP